VENGVEDRRRREGSFRILSHLDFTLCPLNVEGVHVCGSSVHPLLEFNLFAVGFGQNPVASEGYLWHEKTRLHSHSGWLMTWGRKKRTT
jgi:hypothetical protein